MMDAVYVSPEGNDAASGARTSPLRTLARALATSYEHVILLAGIHTEGPFSIERSVLLEGENATLQGSLRIDSPGVGVERLTLQSLDLTAAAEVIVESATISGPPAERVVHATGGSLTLRGSTIEGGTIASIQLDGGAHGTIARSEISGGSNGLIAIDSTLDVEDVVVTDADQISLLLDSSQATIRGGRYGGTRNLTVGITGSAVEMTNVALDASDFAVFSVAPSIERTTSLELNGGTIAHGAHAAILSGGGTLIVRGTSFTGSADQEGDDAIVARNAAVTIEGASFLDAGGFAIGLYEGSSGTISAMVTGPRLGGITAQSATVAIDDTTISGCRGGSGIYLGASNDAAIERTIIDGCSEAGVLAMGGSGSIRDSKILNNAQFGVAAFAGALIRVASSTISGSPLATFATCGDGASVTLLEGNTIDGLTTDCP